MSEHRVKRPFIPRMVRALAIPIIAFWALLAVTTNTFVPQVEKVAEELAGPMVPHYAPSQRALLAIGEKFHESNSTNLTMLVFEADRPLGDVDHRYYDDLMRRLKQDTAACAVRHGSVGKADHCGGGAKPRRQGHLRAVASRGRYRPNPSESVR